MRSLPSWERGLKSAQRRLTLLAATVAPLVGAWIEISLLGAVVSGAAVAPLVGAWIEIPKSCLLILGQNSRSPRGSVD